MTDETPKPPPDDTNAPGDESRERPSEATPEPTDEAPKQTDDKDEKPAKPKLSDEEKAAKIAAAKAKAAAAKAAKQDEDTEPKPPWEEKPVPPEHSDAADDPDVVALADAVAGSVLGADSFADQITISIPRDKLLETCRFLKDERRFSFLVDLTAVDWPEREEGRFDVVYWMHRFEDSKRVRLRTVLPESESIASVTEVWKTANWLEREAYDMFGILFDGHPALERILTWEGFNGHPLRKDFPVEGIDTGAAIYPDVYPPGGGPVREEEIEKPPPKKTKPEKTEKAEDAK
jgi:NADH-quinone oxidoreductase subunit C